MWQRCDEKLFLFLFLYLFSSRNIFAIWSWSKMLNISFFYKEPTAVYLHGSFVFQKQWWILRCSPDLKILWLIRLMTTDQMNGFDFDQKHIKFIIHYLTNLSVCLAQLPCAKPVFSPYGHPLLWCQFPHGDPSKWAHLLEV